MHARKSDTFYIVFLLVMALSACSTTASRIEIDLDALQAGAVYGNAEDQYELGVMFYKGEGLPKHDGKAYAWLSLAKAQGYVPAGKMLDEVSKGMTPELISQAQNLTSVLYEEPRYLMKKRDQLRKADVSTIQNALYQNSIDNGKSPEIPIDAPKEICRTSGDECVGMVDLSFLLGSYLVGIPRDALLPYPSHDAHSGYMIQKDNEGRIIVSAPHAELEKPIELKR
jgi:hypothetical protein